jgi:hypothetical protein
MWRVRKVDKLAVESNKAAGGVQSIVSRRARVGRGLECLGPATVDEMHGYCQLRLRNSKARFGSGLSPQSPVSFALSQPI